MSTKIVSVEGEMKGETALADAARRGKEKKEIDEAVWRLLDPVRNYLIFLYVGTIVTTLAPRAVPKYAPAAASSAHSFLAGGYDLSLTVALFAAATLLLQAHLARVLKPSPRPRLAPFHAWALAVITCLFITNFFLGCLTFGDEDVGGYGEWAVAAGATVANLVMSARTVKRHLA